MSDRTEDRINTAIVTVLAIVVICFLGLIVDGCSEHKMQVEAVKHGAAEWVPDDGGQTKFTWKEPTND